MPNELKIVIDADVNKAVNGLKQVDKAFTQTANDAQKFGTNITQGTQKATAALAKLPNTSNAATQSLINLSRVAQDAPFGFLGIANNLNPLLESFQRLQAESKATGTSLTKNLLGALTGPAGIGLALGVGSSLLIKFGDDLINLITPSQQLSNAIDKAVEGMGKESTSVITMVKALQSGTLTTEQFKKVKAELIEQAPEFQKTFEGDKISIEASDTALTKYIQKLTTTIRVTAALGIVNETIAKSIAVIAKGGEVSFGDQLLASFKSVFGTNGLGEIAKKGIESINKATDQLKPENISKLLDETFKKLGISFNDFADTVDGDVLKKKLDKIKADFEKFQNETIAKAKQFAKEFGSAFVVPDLEESFFKTKQQIFKESLKLLNDFKTGNLKIKIPVAIDFEPFPDPEGLAITKDVIDNFFKGVKIEQNIPVEIVPDFTLAKGSIDAIDKKLDLRKQFSVLGDLGLKEFNNIDFSNINKGIEEATKRLSGMMAIATTLNQAIGQGLTNAFNSMFDAVLEGKNVFKALANGIKDLIIQTIKAIAQMLILKFVTNLIFPGGGSAIPIKAPFGFTPRANLGFNGIGSQVFQNVIQVNVSGQISNDVIRLSGQRSTTSGGRFG